MARFKPGGNVYEATVGRFEQVYSDGHRVVHSFSGGKDSLAVLETAIIAARRTNRLPVEVVMRDEEVGWPDHYEFCERTANRPEVDFTWIVAGEPHWWAYDRKMPFWWSFDNRLAPQQWMRQYPSFTTFTQEITISAINNPVRFPPPPDKDVIVTMGLRAEESRRRMMGVFSQGGWLSGPDKHRSRGALPIYDWREKDVWHAIAEFGWDYPSSYVKLHQAGLPKRANRMGAFLNPYAASTLPLAAKAFPAFFDKMYARFPGLRSGMGQWERLTRPTRKVGETWEACFWRTCVDEAPEWIALRSEKLAKDIARRHTNNSSGSHDRLPFHDTEQCFACGAGRGSWQQMANGAFLGDPFSETTMTGLPYVQPQDMRPELRGTPAGMWGQNGKGHPG